MQRCTPAIPYYDLGLATLGLNSLLKIERMPSLFGSLGGLMGHSECIINMNSLPPRSERESTSDSELQKNTPCLMILEINLTASMPF